LPPRRCFQRQLISTLYLHHAAAIADFSCRLSDYAATPLFRAADTPLTPIFASLPLRPKPPFATAFIAVFAAARYLFAGHISCIAAANFHYHFFIFAIIAAAISFIIFASPPLRFADAIARRLRLISRLFAIIFIFADTCSRLIFFAGRFHSIIAIFAADAIRFASHATPHAIITFLRLHIIFSISFADYFRHLFTPPLSARHDAAMLRCRHFRRRQRAMHAAHAAAAIFDCSPYLLRHAFFFSFSFFFADFSRPHAAADIF
jgi:hypothetical protein